MNFRLICCFFLLMQMCQNASAADVPSNVTLTATETAVKVDWSGDTDADNYFVYWGTDSGNLSNRVTVDDSVTEYTIADLESGTTYYVAVSSNDNSVESDRSAVESITTLEDTGIPSTPAGFIITDINAIGENSVALKWNSNTETDLDHYNIYFSTVSGAFDNATAAGDADAAGFTVSGLTASTRYYFYISAIDISGNESEKSDALIIDTLVDTRPPNKPQSISGELSDSDAITVTIQDGNSQMADFSGNILYYGEVAGGLDSQVDLGRNFSYVLNNLPVGSVWYFSAVSYDYSGNQSAATQEISVSIEKTNRFLNQPEDFDGGCFVRSAGGSVRDTGFPVAFFLMMTAAAILWPARKFILKYVRIGILAFLLVGFYAGVSNAETPEMPGNNIIGISGGYLIPAESDFKDYYGENIFPVYGFYERFFSSHISVDIESGFWKEKGYLLTESGAETRIKTKLTIVPVSASLKFSMKIIPHVVGYVGVGPDYWYTQEQTDDEAVHPEIEEWVGGFHGKLGVRLYNTDENFRGTGALIESSYSQIDRFGDNKTDIGGWAFKFGIFYHF